ncbi:hypothetical protein AGABI1DRAFT_128123 [Agaricus bisporus var. burnettii JB137-S8]|uniref:Uncharacterized protein n=1 Tax=Agaricus bisporus var. burnettii (strain JB137-S8 / ATCC MYA-4627 / FGSC 10392) TaxID=597362 RepID=K5XBH1_AGABU|nr:uncharacterized protein AGABI1DRAFT_128123 [Agaricus bisporus var. burnettii JB137-S8]EKM80452.1 hypothetical protein AGABI1DRAFT_128123 [Agaricus bisporus var. burnettii JB137-S8]
MTANCIEQFISVLETELERDLELERRKVRDLQETSRERDKEYQKLKGWTQHDKLKRKTILGPTTIEPIAAPQSKTPEGQQSRAKLNTLGGATGNEMVMSGMEMNGVQRTPLVPRVQTHVMMASASNRGSGWNKPKATGPMGGQHRQPFGPPTPQVLALDRSFRSTSDYSDSGNEVEHMLLPGSFSRSTSGWSAGAARSRPVFAPPIAPKRASMGFRPAGNNR